jgi:hypothetical protein
MNHDGERRENRAGAKPLVSPGRLSRSSRNSVTRTSMGRFFGKFHVVRVGVSSGSLTSCYCGGLCSPSEPLRLIASSGTGEQRVLYGSVTTAARSLVSIRQLICFILFGEKACRSGAPKGICRLAVSQNRMLCARTRRIARFCLASASSLGRKSRIGSQITSLPIHAGWERGRTVSRPRLRAQPWSVMAVNVAGVPIVHS